ncbi:MAG: glycosyltransferase [Anaerolineales bacterium]|nr:glycosyltransferase [Anaerolineales bacterium]MDW8277974.1 glycosyltransferase [Anaerolineales bacterium]
MEFSVIIPTLNEEVLLPHLLADLQAQTFRDFEVIVADAGSRDRTVEMAQQMGARVVPGGMPAVGRNRGAEAANGNFLVFLDADTRVASDFLEKVHAELEERFLDLATCEIQPISNHPLDGLLHDFTNLAIKIGQFTDPHAPGFCIIISRRLFRRVGGFNESLKLAEDHDLVKRASQFRPLRVLNSARVQVSVRRLEKEGRVNLISKYVAVELYRILLGEIKTDIFKYEFGNFSREQQLQLDAKVKQSRKLIAGIGKEYARLLKLSGGNLAALPAEALDFLREQFEALKELMRGIVKMIGKE